MSQGRILEPEAPFGGGGGQVYYYRFNAPLIKRTIALPANFAGTKLVQYDHIVFMNAVEGKQQEWEEWYDHRHSPDMLMGDGVMTSQRTTLARPSGNAKPPATRVVRVPRMVTSSTRHQEHFPSWLRTVT